MKILSLLLLGALLALSQAAAFPETVLEAGMEGTAPEETEDKKISPDESLTNTLNSENKPETEETVPEETEDQIVSPDDSLTNVLDTENRTENEETVPEVLNNMERRSCPTGWSRYGRRCFRYYPTVTSWNAAQSNCRSVRANLASVQNSGEYYEIQKIITAAGHRSREAWLGGSDAQREGRWTWIDGTTFRYTHWCRGEPNNLWGNQNCLSMNNGGSRCWDDNRCSDRKTYVCARNL